MAFHQLSESDTHKYFSILREGKEVNILHICKAMGMHVSDEIKEHLSECKACHERLYMYVTFIIYKEAVKLKIISGESIWCPYSEAKIGRAHV